LIQEVTSSGNESRYNSYDYGPKDWAKPDPTLLLKNGGGFWVEKFTGN
jgi:hypothetical protein